MVQASRDLPYYLDQFLRAHRHGAVVIQLILDPNSVLKPASYYPLQDDVESKSADLQVKTWTLPDVKRFYLSFGPVVVLCFFQPADKMLVTVWDNGIEREEKVVATLKKHEQLGDWIFSMADDELVFLFRPIPSVPTVTGLHEVTVFNLTKDR